MTPIRGRRPRSRRVSLNPGRDSVRSRCFDASTHSLMKEQAFLDGESAAESGKGAVRAHNTMSRDDYSEWVGADGLSNSTGGLLACRWREQRHRMSTLRRPESP